MEKTPRAALKDPYRDTYANYKPDFLAMMQQGSGYGGAFSGWIPPEKTMRLSSEPDFFTLNMVNEDQRANALVDAALAKEEDGQYREALKMYQLVIEKYPDQLYRVSRYGVFVPISRYCQRRILLFEPSHLGYYRTLYDARAKESFEQARRKHSLLGLSEVAETLLATTWGGPAVEELGNAALDSGHYLEALEHYATIVDYFPPADVNGVDLALKMKYCGRLLARADVKPPAASAKTALAPDTKARLEDLVERAVPDRPPFHSQYASEPNIAADDYTLFPPTRDVLGLATPVWQANVPGTRLDHFVFTQPAVTKNSVVCRSKNVVYCHSILTGELRWTNDLGGRAVWQNRNERQYPQEEVVVQDGLVFTAVSKGGPSLVALDEVTGQLKWAYGPMVASSEEETRMRFEAAPAGGPRTIYAGYVLDNIEGDTHTDTEYGLMAFDSVSGRVRWRRPLCTLAPGKFSAGFAEKRRNRIRSFTSPPLYHEGTVYYTTNAGAVTAVDARSGTVKWLIRYPYWPSVHDATREFGALHHTGHWYKHPVRPHEPMFWYNQRPLLVGEMVYVLPVDTSMVFCFDRQTGKVRWTRPKATFDAQGRNVETGACYLLGPTREGHLVIVRSGSNEPVHLLDAQTGQTVWKSGNLILQDTQPVMTQSGFTPYPWAAIQVQRRWWEVTARPFLTQDDRLYVMHTAHVDTGYTGAGVQGWAYHLAEVSLSSRKIDARRRYYSTELLVYCDQLIRSLAPECLRALEDLPHKDDETKARIEACKAVIADHVPVNDHGPFLPFSRITFERYGVPFELRVGVKTIEMIYDVSVVKGAVDRMRGPDAEFARAELSLAESRTEEAGARLRGCLDTMSSEDLDFRAAVNQQLYRVSRMLARSAIRSGDPDREVKSVLGMSATANTLEEEIETLFALSEALERKGDLRAAARCLRSVIATYGHHEYPVPSILALEPGDVTAAAGGVLERSAAHADSSMYGREFSESARLLKKGLPLYLGAVSPIPRTLTVRAGELAAARLVRLQKGSAPFAAEFERTAETELGELAKAGPDDLLYRLWEFPGTAAAQKVLDDLFGRAATERTEPGRRRLWQLSDAARAGGLQIPEACRPLVLAPSEVPAQEQITLPQQARALDLSDAEGINWLVLERRDDPGAAKNPELIFLGGRVRKRLDNKFILVCLDVQKGEKRWDVRDIRLKGTGQEPGFFEAFVHGDVLMVHGLYDVLAYSVAGGKPLWRYRVPFDFEIRSAAMSGSFLVLSGQNETVALYIDTTSPDGEVAWQVREMGDLYVAPYFHGDRLVSVRKMPFNLTVRARATGRLLGRLNLPDLSLHEAHPLLENGPEAVPAAHDGKLLALTDGWYYIMLDTERLRTVWKRLIDENDLTREPAMRLTLSAGGGGRDGYLATVKENYDQKVIYMLSAESGRVLWTTDVKDARSPQPMYSTFIEGDRIYGIGLHAGQGFYFVGRDCKTGQQLFKQDVSAYATKPVVSLVPRNFSGRAVVTVQDNQDFEVRVFDLASGKVLHTLKEKGIGPFGEHGRVSSAVQGGRLVLMSRDKLNF